MTLPNEQTAPGIIRAACRARFYDAIDRLSEIAFDDEARNADVIKAIHELGAFGLGTADQGAVHIHAGEGSQVIGVVHLPALDPVPDDEAVQAGASEVAAAVGPLPSSKQLPAS